MHKRNIVRTTFRDLLYLAATFIIFIHKIYKVTEEQEKLMESGKFNHLRCSKDNDELFLT